MFLDVGIVVLRSIKGSLTPPRVSIPNVKGVTSNNTISLDTSPAIIPACIAAPNATASIGSTPLSGDLPMTSPTNFLTSGILVGPPIRTILLMSDFEILASVNDFSIDCLHFSTILVISSSSLALVSLISRFCGPVE